MVHNLELLDPSTVLALEESGLVTSTFRRLDSDRQEAVTDAILKEALTRGPTQIRVKQVASEAGVSVGSLYQYFGSRDGLLEFAIQLCGMRLTNEFESFVPALTELPLREGLFAWVQGGIEWSQQQAALMRFFVKGAYEGDEALRQRLVRPIAVAMQSAVLAMLEAGIERGEVRQDVDLKATARAVNGLLITVADSRLLPYLNDYFQMGDEPEEFDKTVSAAIDLIVKGLS